MAKIPDRVDSDEEYNELLERIVEGARQIDLPLTDAKKKASLTWYYDKMVAVAREYRTRGG
jgi:hypothetical protein